MEIIDNPTAEDLKEFFNDTQESLVQDWLRTVKNEFTNERCCGNVDFEFFEYLAERLIEKGFNPEK